MEIAAYHMATQKQWADIVLHSSTLEQISLLKDWLKQHRTDIVDIAGKRTTGYRALFYGPSGTGKSFAAALLGNEPDLPVYRIDLQAVVSKYIGETEKNLDLLFSRAEEKSWILFFDGADALFGKRSAAGDSHDRYANIEVSYLLQKIEAYTGLVILATTMKNNRDDAFLRRFHLVVDFPPPDAAQRKKLWQMGLAGSKIVAERIDLDALAAQYELSPASIIHIAHAMSDDALTKVPAAATHNLLMKEIENEYSRISKRQTWPDH